MKTRTLADVLAHIERIVECKDEQSPEGVTTATLLVGGWVVCKGDDHNHIEHMANEITRRLRIVARRAHRIGVHEGRAEMLALRASRAGKGKGQ